MSRHLLVLSVGEEERERELALRQHRLSRVASEQSPCPRLISPHINHTSAAPVRAVAEATIDMAPDQSQAR
jgi:hypothetical protein